MGTFRLADTGGRHASHTRPLRAGATGKFPACQRERGRARRRAVSQIAVQLECTLGLGLSRSAAVATMEPVAGEMCGERTFQSAGALARRRLPPAPAIVHRGPWLRHRRRSLRSGAAQVSIKIQDRPEGEVQVRARKHQGGGHSMQKRIVQPVYCSRAIRRYSLSTTAPGAGGSIVADSRLRQKQKRTAGGGQV